MRMHESRGIHIRLLIAAASASERHEMTQSLLSSSPGLMATGMVRTVLVVVL